MEELVPKGRDGGWGELIIGNEEVLQPIDNEAHIAVAGLDDLHDPVADLLEEEMRLSEVNLFKANLALGNTMDQVTHACDQFEVIEAALLMHAYLDVLTLPFALFSELLRRHVSY